MERTYPPQPPRWACSPPKVCARTKRVSRTLFANCDQDVSCEDAWRRGTNGAGAERFPSTLPRSFATVATRRRGTQSLTLQRPQARPTPILAQGRQRHKEGAQTSVPPSSWRALNPFSMRRTSVRLSRRAWSGASSSIFHRAACASPSVPYSVRSTVPSSSNSTRAQLN
jgi:hypothetical protein